jgi:hypothetical protein
MNKALTQAQVERYRREGYVFPLQVLDDAELADYGRRLSESEARHGHLAGPLAQKPHLLFTWAAELVRHPRVLDAVEDILGPDLLCWSSSFFIKQPRDPAFVSWHQDATYWGLDRPDILTVWLALSPARRENGCMKIVPGSHRTQVAHRDTFEPGNLLTRGQEIAVEVDEAEAVYMELAAGQASIHHVLLFHGSPPNASDVRRLGLAIRYMPTSVRQASGVRDTATLVRGTDRYGFFDLVPPPEADMSDAAVAAHAVASEASRTILLAGASTPAR